MRKDYTLTPTSRDGKPRRPIDIVMTPMIDVIFLLLVFFLATSSFQVVEQLMPSAVSEMEPSSGSSDQPPPEPTDDAIEQIIVKLTVSGGEVVAMFNEAAFGSFDELKERMRAIGGVAGDTPVIIDPDGDVDASHVVKAYDWSREAGLSRVYLAVEP